MEGGSQREREKNSDQLPLIHATTQEGPATQACAPTRKQAQNLPVCGTTLQLPPTEKPGQGFALFLVQRLVITELHSHSVTLKH